MRVLADQMQGPSEREHPMMAMVTNGQRTAARSAPLLLDCQFDACELRVYWPAIRHESPLLVQDMVGNQHTIDRPILTVSLGVTSAVAYTYGCADGRISPTRCAVIAGALGDRCSQRR